MDRDVTAPGFSAGRAAVGALIGLAGHLLAFAAGFLAGQLVEPSQGGGFEDVAAVALTFLGVEVLVALACLIAGVVLLARGRRDLGAGLLIGWLVGAIAAALLIRASG